MSLGKGHPLEGYLIVGNNEKVLAKTKLEPIIYSFILKHLLKLMDKMLSLEKSLGNDNKRNITEEKKELISRIAKLIKHCLDAGGSFIEERLLNLSNKEISLEKTASFRKNTILFKENDPASQLKGTIYSILEKAIEDSRRIDTKKVTSGSGLENESQSLTLLKNLRFLLGNKTESSFLFEKTSEDYFEEISIFMNENMDSIKESLIPKLENIGSKVLKTVQKLNKHIYSLILDIYYQNMESSFAYLDPLDIRTEFDYALQKTRNYAKQFQDDLKEWEAKELETQENASQLWEMQKARMIENRGIWEEEESSDPKMENR